MVPLPLTGTDSLPARALLPLESLYRLGVRLHQWRVARRVSRGEWPLRLPRPVLSVGNIVVGGAGKTPVVEALARDWLRRGGRPAILSRGYRGGTEGNDELQLLRRRLPGVPHLQDRNRHRGGLELLRRRPEIDLFLLDDGFQHRPLCRDLDLVVLDATRPFGHGRLLPRGLLREPWSGLRRAGAFLLTRAEDASPHKMAILRAFLTERFPSIPLLEASARIEGVRSSLGKPGELDRERRWAAFCGIGNPHAYFRSLRRLGFDLRGERIYPDHHRFKARDLRAITRWAARQGADGIICTEKDGVKLEGLSGFATAEPPIFQLRLHFELGSPHPLDLLAAVRPAEPRVPPREAREKGPSGC